MFEGQLFVRFCLLGLCLSFILVLKAISHILWVKTLLKHVPGPSSSSFLWGEERKLFFSAPGLHWSRWHSDYGPVVKFNAAFYHKHLSITDRKAISFILGTGAYSFPKPSGVRAWFKATLGEGIVWTEDKSAHERQKRALAPAFGIPSVRKLTPVYYETANTLVNQWTKIIDSCADGRQATIDATKWAGRFALDTIGRCAFSYDLNSLAGEPHALADSLDGLTNNENHISSFYMRALFWIFPSVLSIGKKGEMIRTSKKELGDLASRIWKDVKASGDNDPKNLMSMIWSADKHGLPDDQVIDQMRTVISAGYETVSAVVAWSLYELAINHDLQCQLREEVQSAREPGLDVLNHQFPLLDAIVKETLRIHPPILENHHQASETIAIPLTRPLPGSSEDYLVIPKDTILAIPVNVVQTDPYIWGADAQDFRPSRWLEHKDGTMQLNKELLVFSEGPRKCLGSSFAIAEIKVLLMTIIQNFSLSCLHDIEPFQSFVIRPRIVGQGASSLPLVVQKL